jgi:hypothetical protein
METSIQEQADAGIEVVNARLNYLAEAIPKPVNYAYDPPAGVPRRSGKYVERSVVVRNGREVLSELSLDTNGFVLTEHETAVKDLYDSDEVKSVYYPEVERLLKRATGAERVVIFDHIVRNPLLSERGEKGARSPAKFVHNDYTFKSAPRRVRDLLPEEAGRLLKNRFAEINVWRAIRGPIESSPLALCDARSLGTEDIVPIDLVYRERVGEIYGFLYNPKHRWYYFPRLERNEAVLLKCYDSKDDGRARASPRIPRLMIRTARPRQRRAKASKSVRWSSGRPISRTPSYRMAMFACAGGLCAKHDLLPASSAENAHPVRVRTYPR